MGSFVRITIIDMPGDHFQRDFNHDKSHGQRWQHNKLTWKHICMDKTKLNIKNMRICDSLIHSAFLSLSLLSLYIYLSLSQNDSKWNISLFNLSAMIFRVGATRRHTHFKYTIIAYLLSWRPPGKGIAALELWAEWRTASDRKRLSLVIGISKIYTLRVSKIETQ